MTCYEIYYEKYGIKQRKTLVSVDTYVHYIKPIEHYIYELQCEIYNCGKKNKTKKAELEAKVEQQKKKLKPYGEYFVIGSPLYKAISTGILVLPVTQGGTSLVVINKIDL